MHSCPADRPPGRLPCYLIAAGDDPLPYLERRAYLAAVRAAVSGLESARVVLAKARQRIEGAGRGDPGMSSRQA